MAKKEKAKQPNLYGDEDKVFNVLETQLTALNADIKAKYDKIEKLKGEIKTLETWREEVEDARDIAAKLKKDAEAKGT